MGNINPSVVREILEHLQNVIANVEHMRGVGRDGKLRYIYFNLKINDY